MKKTLNVNEHYHLINHGPCIIVTSGSLPEKRINAASIAWVTPLNDDPPLVIICVASTHYTAKLIKKYKEFVINIPGQNLLKAIKICGSVSGNKTDKFKKAGITPLKGKKVTVPFIKESIGHIECTLFDKKEYEGVILFIGKVVHCEIESRLYKGYLISTKAKTPHHLGSNIFSIDGKIVRI